MKHPFRQKESNGKLIREFSKDVDSSELVWHRDRADRYVRVCRGKGWQLQLENKLPLELTSGKVYYIPRNTYHRVIKGQTSLVVEIREEKAVKITKKHLRRIIREEAGPAEKDTLRDAIFAYMKSSVELSVPGEAGTVTDDHVNKAVEDLSSDSKIAAEEYVDADPDNLGISGLGEASVRITKSRLRRIIKEEKQRLIKEQSKEKMEGVLLADLTMTSDTIGQIADEMYGLVMPDTPNDPHRRKGPTYGDELSDRLRAEADKLDTLYDRLEIYFQSKDSPLPHAGVSVVDDQGNIAVAKGTK